MKFETRRLTARRAVDDVASSAISALPLLADLACYPGHGVIPALAHVRHFPRLRRRPQVSNNTLYGHFTQRYTENGLTYYGDDEWAEEGREDDRSILYIILGNGDGECSGA